MAKEDGSLHRSTIRKQKGKEGDFWVLLKRSINQGKGERPEGGMCPPKGLRNEERGEVSEEHWEWVAKRAGKNKNH